MAFGDKNPRSYYNYEHILREMRGGVVFICLRDAQEIFNSWDARARNPNDNLWDPGLNWFIAYLEIVALQHVMAEHDLSNVYLVNYSHLVRPETRIDATRQVFELLGLVPERETEDFLSVSLKKTITVLEKKRGRSSAQNEILNTSHMRCYAELLDGIDITPVVAVKTKLEEFSNRLQSEDRRFRGVFDDIVRELEDDAPFKATWAKTTDMMKECFAAPPLIDLVNRTDELLGMKPRRLGRRRLKSAFKALFKR